MGCWDELFQWPLANGISPRDQLFLHGTLAHGFDLMFIPSVVGKQAVWSSGVILPQNARGPGCNSHNSPFRGLSGVEIDCNTSRSGCPMPWAAFPWRSGIAIHNKCCVGAMFFCANLKFALLASIHHTCQSLACCKFFSHLQHALCQVQTRSRKGSGLDPQRARLKVLMSVLQAWAADFWGT